MDQLGAPTDEGARYPKMRSFENSITERGCEEIA
jgi:hypothetical protein